MAVRITYNNRNIDFTNGVVDKPILPARNAMRSMSATGGPETLNVSARVDVVRIFLRNFQHALGADVDLKTALLEFSQWADMGLPWVLYLDHAITVNTTLDAVVLAGASSIPVTSATGVVSGRRYVIESSEHVATVEASNTATDPVTTTNAVNFGFPAQSRFRDFEVLPMVGSIRIIENAQLFFDVEISGQIDRRALP